MHCPILQRRQHTAELAVRFQSNAPPLSSFFPLVAPHCVLFPSTTRSTELLPVTWTGPLLPPPHTATTAPILSPPCVAALG